MTRLAAAAVLLLTASVAAAPLPPPRPLSAELLEGRWNYRWGSLADGWIVFGVDGRYWSRHTPGDAPEYVGRYDVRGEVVTLYEGRCPCEGDWHAPTSSSSYPVRLATGRYPVLSGACGGTVVVFSR